MCTVSADPHVNEIAFRTYHLRAFYLLPPRTRQHLSIYTEGVKKKKRSKKRKQNKKEIGMVYCSVVPKEIIYTRRNIRGLVQKLFSLLPLLMWSILWRLQGVEGRGGADALPFSPFAAVRIIKFRVSRSNVFLTALLLFFPTFFLFLINYCRNLPQLNRRHSSSLSAEQSRFLVGSCGTWNDKNLPNSSPTGERTFG